MQKLTLTIEKLNSSGVGIARHEARVYFVPWTVPGDLVVVQVEKNHKNYSDARLLHVEQASVDRIEPECPYFFKCGGCQLQQMHYQAQLKWKRVIVADALKKIARIENPTVKEVIASPKVWNYRNRIQIHQSSSGKWGFNQARSHQVVEIDQCLIAQEELNLQLSELQAKPVNEKTVELRVQASRSFGQINSLQNQNLIELVLEFLNPQSHETIADIFCGSGNFSFPLAKKTNTVIAIEKVSLAVCEGQMLARLEGVNNIIWKCGMAKRMLLELNQKKTHIDSVVVDPPRRGLAECLELLCLLRPQKIVYVSCDPATFARDTASFIKADYNLEIFQPVDMFPQTAHVEVVGLFKSTIAL